MLCPIVRLTVIKTWLKMFLEYSKFLLSSKHNSVGDNNYCGTANSYNHLLIHLNPLQL